jgi:hypothetical protein
MKTRRIDCARAAALAVAAVLGGAARADSPPAVSSAMAAAKAPSVYPKLASTPAAPKDVRSLSDWAAAVRKIKAEGAQTSALAKSEPWGLAGTDDWAARERDADAPPPPMTSPAGGDTETFAQAMRAAGSPPAAPKRRPAE